MSNPKKTLVILTPGFPENEADSTCLPMQQSLVKHLKETHPGLNIIVLSFQYPYHTNPYTVFGIPVIPFSGRNKGGLKRLMLRRKVNSCLEDLHSKHSITGLISFWYNECAWSGKQFGDKHGIKHCCWILGQDAKKENKYPRIIRPKESELAALSDFLQVEFEKNHHTRPKYVIPPGIDENQFVDLPAKKDIDILAAGSLIPLKQFDAFIEIVSGIKQQFPGLKAVLAGEGPEKEKLLELTRKFELGSTLTITGELPHQELLQLMQRTKVFLHTSEYEGFGVVCLEALHAGAHVISFVKPMNEEITHWQIVTTKEEMIKRSIEILYRSPAEYKRVTPFRLQDTARSILGLFET